MNGNGDAGDMDVVGLFSSEAAVLCSKIPISRHVQS
jgi:hypothetical protein